LVGPLYTGRCIELISRFECSSRFHVWILTDAYVVHVSCSVMVIRKYLEDPCVWVESNTTTLNILSSQAEIAIGFLLIISLLS
jgi:hypothetical protein